MPKLKKNRISSYFLHKIENIGRNKGIVLKTVLQYINNNFVVLKQNKSILFFRTEPFLLLFLGWGLCVFLQKNPLPFESFMEENKSFIM